MQEITLKVCKRLVYNEVAKTTAYAGAKQVTAEDASAYDRVFATDADQLMLERFWVEAADVITALLMPHVQSVTTQNVSNGVQLDSDYMVVLELSNRFETAMSQSIESNMFNFFVAVIVMKWLEIADKDAAERYGKEAAGILEEIEKKVYFKRKPRR